LSIGEEALAMFSLWRTTGYHGSSSWNTWSKWEPLSQATSNQPRQSTQIRDRTRCLGRVREWSHTISYMKRCARIDCQVKDRDSEFNAKIKGETRSRRGTK
jgi:hypothetical protein